MFRYQYMGRATVEEVHLEFLCSEFNLRKADPELSGNDLRFDITSRRNRVYELKCRTYSRNQGKGRKRPQSDYEWWQLDCEQTRHYEDWARKHNKELYWILVLGTMSHLVTRMPSISEPDIERRDIYVLPWGMYHLVKPTPRQVNRWIGLQRLIENYRFKCEPVHNGVLHMAEPIYRKVRIDFK